MTAYLCRQTADQFTQKAFDFLGIFEPVARCSYLWLFADKNTDPALFEYVEGVFVGAIIADEDRERHSTLLFQRFQQPENCFAFVPIDIGQQFVNFLAVDPAKLAMPCRHCIHSCRNSNGVVFAYVAIVRSYRKMFSFQLRTWNFIKRFA